MRTLWAKTLAPGFAATVVVAVIAGYNETSMRRQKHETESRSISVSKYITVSNKPHKKQLIFIDIETHKRTIDTEFKFFRTASVWGNDNSLKAKIFFYSTDFDRRRHNSFVGFYRNRAIRNYPGWRPPIITEYKTDMSSISFPIGITRLIWDARTSYSDENEGSLKLNQRTLRNVGALGRFVGNHSRSYGLLLKRSMLLGGGVGLTSGGDSVVSCGGRQLLHVERLTRGELAETTSRYRQGKSEQCDKARENDVQPIPLVGKPVRRSGDLGGPILFISVMFIMAVGLTLTNWLGRRQVRKFYEKNRRNHASKAGKHQS
jgi:hypothetical protein